MAEAAIEYVFAVLEATDIDDLERLSDSGGFTAEEKTKISMALRRRARKKDLEMVREYALEKYIAAVCT